MEASGTKEKIFMAAVGLFAEKGFSATTVRDICRRAEGSNLNAVNYYFGGKRQLYNNILETVAAEGGRRMQAAKMQMDLLRTPEEKLRRFILGYMRMLYGGGEFSEQLCRIYIRELADPSPFFLETVQRHTVPQTQEIMELVRELLYEGASEELVRNSLSLIVGQITYYSFSWPVYSRVHPEQPRMDFVWDKLAETIYVFSLAGMRALSVKEQNSNANRGNRQ